MSQPKIKICGITNLEDAEHSLKAGASFLGFNFYQKSKRYLEPEKAKKIIAALPSDKKYFGVFVNHSRQEVTEIAAISGISGLQFHGDEPDSMLEDWPGLEVIKALRIKTFPVISELKTLLEKADYLLFDSFSDKEYGGTGKTIASDILEGLVGRDADGDILKKLFIAGGVTSSNIKSISNLSPFAIDLASGVESDNPRKKSLEKIKALFRNLE